MDTFTIWDAIISKCIIGQPNPLVKEFDPDTIEVSEIEYEAVSVGEIHNFNDKIYGPLMAIVSRKERKDIREKESIFSIILEFYKSLS